MLLGNVAVNSAQLPGVLLGLGRGGPKAFEGTLWNHPRLGVSATCLVPTPFWIGGVDVWFGYGKVLCWI